MERSKLERLSPWQIKASSLAQLDQAEAIRKELEVTLRYGNDVIAPRRRLRPITMTDLERRG